jgi:membrane-associated phospholipid phosphatase
MNATLQLSRSLKLGRRQCAPLDLRFHRQMAWGTAVALAISVAGCALTSAHVDNLRSILIGLGVALAMVSPLPLYWHEKGRLAMRDAALTLPWAMLLAVILPIPVGAGARLAFPLQDLHLAQMDAAIGISVPGITAWAARHWLGHLANWSYPLLNPLLAASAILPALTGKVNAARRFLVANLLAFLIGLPLFALLPAIGPWYGYHLAPTAAQLGCQTGLLTLRIPGPYSIHPAGIVCFPSFHVIWAILCAVALWGVKPLRLPVCILSSLIVFSTMTTGWHYASDVIAGAAIAVCASMLAARLTHKWTGS